MIISIIIIACAMNVIAGIFGAATDQSVRRGLSMDIIYVRTRNMVNYYSKIIYYTII